MNTLTILSGQWMPSRLRYPLLFLLPLLLLGSTLLGGERFLPILPVTQEPLRSEQPEAAQAAATSANLVATDRLFPFLSDELLIRAQIEEGVLPIWTPLAGLGSPLAAGSLSAPWNPLRWPLLLLDPAAASGWHALLSLVLAGLGMMMFLEGRGLKFTAAMFGALAYQSCGFLIANLHYVMKVDAAIWAPWCLWGVDLVYRGRKNAGLIIFFGVGLSALAGFPPVFIFVATLTLAWILKRALEAIREPREVLGWRGSLGASLLFAGLGVLAGAVHLYPMWELSQESTRQPQDPLAIAAQSLPHAALLTTIMPTAFGGPTDTRPANCDAAVWWLLGEEDLERGLAANRLEWHLYAGVTVLALALAGILAKTRRARFPLLIVLATCGFLFAWPVFDFLYGLPGANLGSPARAAPLAGLGIAWLAALGFDALLEGQGLARLGAVLVACGCGLLGLILLLTLQPEEWAADLESSLQARYSVDAATIRGFFTQAEAMLVADRLREGAKTLLLISILVFVLALYAGRLTVRGSGVAGCALLVFEATLAGLPQTTVPRSPTEALFPASPTIDAIREATGSGRVLRLDQSPTGIDDVLHLARPNLLSVYGISDLTTYSAFPSKRLHEVWRELDEEGTYRGGAARLSDPALLDAPLLDLLRVTCVLSRAPLHHPRLELRHAGPDFQVYARSGALPQARVVPELRAAGPSPAQRLASPELDPAASALHSEDSQNPGPEGQFKEGELVMERPSPDQIDLSLRDSSGGWLVVHEGWSPGWKATLNGQDVEVLRLDHLYMGLPVPSGNSTIALKYDPSSFRIGVYLSLFSLLAAILITRSRHFSLKRENLSRAQLDHASSESR